MHIKMGDDGRYSMTDIGTITFKRESSSPLIKRFHVCSESKEEFDFSCYVGRPLLRCDVLIKERISFIT